MLRSPKRSAEIEGKVKDFDRTISRIEKKIGFTRPPTPSTSLIIGVATPVLVLAILYFARPGFTMAQAGVRDKAKLAKWTIGFSLAAYAAVYACAVGFRKNKK